MAELVTPDKRYKEIRNILKGYLKKWRSRLGLDYWNITSNWVWANKKDIGEYRAVGGETKTLWPYLTATIDFYLPDLVYCDDDELEEMAVHELTHVLVAEAMEQDGMCTPNQERVVTELARAFLRVDRSK